jgi:hypothetical protein
LPVTRFAQTIFLNTIDTDSLLARGCVSPRFDAHNLNAQDKISDTPA